MGKLFKQGMNRRDMKKLIIIGLTAIIGTGICGCNIKENSSDDTKKNTEIVLNERQKEILEEEGLSTNPEELTYSQKKSIVAIDEMLTAIEKKYNRSFSYAGYIEEGALEEEQLIAYPSDGDKDGESFAVTRTKESGEYVYEDEYVNVVAKQIYAAYILEYCQTQLGENNVKVYSIITNIKDKEMLLKAEQIDFNVSGESCIFVDGEKITEEVYNNFLSSYEKWTEEHGIDENTEFVLLKEEVIKNVNKYNYTNYLSSEYYLLMNSQND